ncbi:50S ribosomal protein L9 [Candidatus Nomurabacteria bacterium RIFCSPLOWO2_01_FULL_36_10b]|uniref:Large ribosomal subunit protein bL9 n=1 Tax=Candidatus Nomurabacteria bacterium RIFCSPLOWO2_01_FULL_36_10b TaxID=1801766 RepID=A0A1F6WPQ3_9BACT|nr:MAG: 50S ribosomal protein L9 [Candidatus Nomurabacteria bacterium RIFCSPLOWO2_01_FULL_36_10b]
MKVILLDNVKKLGERYETVNVKNGYAHNFLIPRKLAVQATPDVLSRVANMRSEYEKEHGARIEKLKEAFESISGAKITISHNTNEQGGLYEAIDEESIITAINQKYNTNLKASAIVLDEPIKKIGTYNIKLLSDNVSTDVTIEVVAQE